MTRPRQQPIREAGELFFPDDWFRGRLLSVGDGDKRRAVTATEMKILLLAYAAHHGGIEALPRRGTRGGAADGLPQDWSRPYWHLIGMEQVGEEPDRDWISPQEIEQGAAEALVTVQTRKPITIAIIQALLFPVSIALIGSILGLAIQNDIEEIVILCVVAATVMIIDFWLNRHAR